jgi:5-keto 4-deoxyuronate isomerase
MRGYKVPDFREEISASPKPDTDEGSVFRRNSVIDVKNVRCHNTEVRRLKYLFFGMERDYRFFKYSVNTDELQVVVTTGSTLYSSTYSYTSRA